MHVFRLGQCLGAAKVIVGQIVEYGSCVGIKWIAHNVPFCGTGVSALVTAPSDVFATKNDSLRSQGADEFTPSMVDILLVTLALGVSSVEPKFINGTVFGKQLEKLVKEILVIVINYKLKLCLVFERASFDFTRNGALRVRTLVAVQSVWAFNLIEIGRRKIDAEFESVFLARLRKVAENVALTVLIG